MDLNTFFRAMLRNWWLILLSVLVTTGSAAYFVSSQTPIYRASTTIELRPSTNLADSRDIMRVWDSLEQRSTINTVARKAVSGSMQARVVEELADPLVLEAEISAIVLPETHLIEIRARSSDPELAARIANTIANQLSTEVPTEVLQVSVIDQALPPIAPVEPQPSRVITLGLLSGLFLGVIFALVEQLIQNFYRGRGEPRNGLTTGRESRSPYASARSRRPSGVEAEGPVEPVIASENGLGAVGEPTQSLPSTYRRDRPFRP